MICQKGSVAAAGGGTLSSKTLRVKPPLQLSCPRTSRTAALPPKINWEHRTIAGGSEQVHLERISRFYSKPKMRSRSTATAAAAAAGERARLLGQHQPPQVHGQPASVASTGASAPSSSQQPQQLARGRAFRKKAGVSSSSGARGGSGAGVVASTLTDDTTSTSSLEQVRLCTRAPSLSLLTLS